MVNGQYTLGLALSQAKQDYIGSLQPVGVYDEKTSAELTLYGLPMWKIGTGNASPPAAPAVTTIIDPIVGLTAQSIDTTPVFTSHSTPRGTYWEGGDGVQVTHFRPVQPKEVEEIGVPNAHGALITELTSTSPDVNFDPVFARPVVDNTASEPELPFNDVVFPAQLQAVTHEETAGSGTPTSRLVLVTGQFTGKSAVDATGTGIEDRFTHLKTLVYSTGTQSKEFQPPVFAQVDAVAINTTGGTPTAAQFNVKVADLGGSGVKRVLVGYQDGSTPAWKFIDLVEQGGAWTGQGPRQNVDFRYFVQAVDGSGNVGVTTNKGIYYAQKDIVQTPPSDVVPPTVVIASPTAAVYAFGAPVVASFACVDPDSVVTSCTAILNGSVSVNSGDLMPTATAGTNVLTVTAVAGGVTKSSSVTFTVSAPAGAAIVFARSGHIFKITPAGVVVQLTAGQDDAQPALSSLGTKIAFSRKSADGSRQIFTMDTSGGSVTPLTSSGDNDAPAWLPGSDAKIAFQSSRNGSKGKDIFVMNGDGSSPVNTTNTAGDDVTPAWSPDGTKIAFSSNRSGQFEIFTMTASGLSQKALTNDKRTDVEPAWSPDGSKLAFSSNRATSGTANGQEIYVMGSANGNSQVRLTTITGDDTAPIYRDASTIVFASATANGGGLAKVAPTGGTLTMIAGTQPGDITPG